MNEKMSLQQKRDPVRACHTAMDTRTFNRLFIGVSMVVSVLRNKIVSFRGCGNNAQYL